MQPYFLPYLGYFALIRHTDQWVVFDTVQYINKGWLNRNRILSQSKEGVSYITVPVVKESRDMLIKDTVIDDRQQWRKKIQGQLAFYKKTAPFYKETLAVVNDILEFKTQSISELNVYALKKVCNYIGVDFNYKVFSEDTMGIDKVNAPDEWALYITDAVKGDAYINPPGGKGFFDIKKYKKHGIELKFLSIQLNEYRQRRIEFQPGLSIVDVMMFNSPEEIIAMLDKNIYYD